MAKGKKKAAKKAAKKPPTIGHNHSDDAASSEEMRKIAKAQRKLDEEKATVKKDWRDREKALTERLEKIGFTRDQFKAPYGRFCEIAECKDDDEVETVKQNHLIFLAKQRKAFDALSPNEQMDWINMVQDADEIEKTREEEAAEKAAAELAEAEAAAERGDEPHESESDPV